MIHGFRSFTPRLTWIELIMKVKGLDRGLILSSHFVLRLSSEYMVEVLGKVLTCCGSSELTSSGIESLS